MRQGSRCGPRLPPKQITPHPDYVTQYLQLRTASQSHFRDSGKAGLLAFLGHGDRAGKVEGDYALRRHGDIFVAGKSRARGSSTGSQQATDQCSLAATGETADQRAAACAATHESRGPLALAFACRFIRISRDFVVAYPVDRDAQVSRPLNLP